MTEEDAKTKWCPFARQATLQTENMQGTTLPSGPVANRWMAGKHTNGQTPVERMTLCIASDCMAWRQDRTRSLTSIVQIGGVKPEGWVETRPWHYESPHIEHTTVSGYCGLAGAPGSQ